MTCDDLDSLLHPYLDGEFDQEERFDLERHLAECLGCTRKIQEAQSFRRAVRGRAREAALVAAPNRLRASLQQGVRAVHRRRQLVYWTKVSAAAAAIAIVAGTGWQLRPRPEERLVSDAALRHARGLPFEIEVSNPENVEAWFGGKLDHRVAVPRFPNAKVAGARISNVTDRPAAYISYEAGTTDSELGHRRIGLFVFDDSQGEVDVEPLPEYAVKSRHGYNVAMWRQGEIVYELVTDLDEADIRRMLLEKEQKGGAAKPAEPTQSFPPTDSQPLLSHQYPATPAFPVQPVSYAR